MHPISINNRALTHKKCHSTNNITLLNDVFSISDDGRYLVLVSLDTRLVAGDTNNKFDVICADCKLQRFERISVANGVCEDTKISGNGRYIAYVSSATNLTPNDTNNTRDIMVYDRENKTAEVIDANAEGQIGNHGASHPSISADGRYVCYISGSTNLTAEKRPETTACYLLLLDRQTKTTQYLYKSNYAVISADGRYIAFATDEKLLPEDTNQYIDVYRYDITNKNLMLVSIAKNGEAADGESGEIFLAGSRIVNGNRLGTSCKGLSISANGNVIAFISKANNLTENKVNGKMQIFVRVIEPITIQ